MRSKYERKATDELRAEGWEVDWKIRPSRPIKNYNTDFFNLYDLIARKGSCYRFISIKGTMGIVKGHREAIEADLVPDGCLKEIWAKSKSKKNYWHKLVWEIK